MSKPQERTPAKDKVRLYLVQAVREGWGIERLAETAGVSRNVASAELQRVSEKLAARIDQELNLDLEQMRVGLHKHRRSVLRAIERSMSIVESIQGRLETDMERFPVFTEEKMIGSGEGAQLVTVETATSPAFAKAAVSLAGATKTLAETFRQASGLALAERLTEHKVKLAMGAGKDVNVDAVDVEFDLLPD